LHFSNHIPLHGKCCRNPRVAHGRGKRHLGTCCLWADLGDIARRRRGLSGSEQANDLIALDSNSSRDIVMLDHAQFASENRSVFSLVRVMKNYATKIGSSALVAVFVLLAPSPMAHAGTGTVRIVFAKAGLFASVGHARGTLHFHGRNYPLRITGVSVGTVGFGLTRLTGHAHNLRTAADIVGTYSAVSVSMAVAGGAKAARLLNSNGVVYLQLEGPQVGLELSASVSGMTISLR
jgi:hypothetical protein